MSIQFISPQYVKDNTIVEENVNENLLDPVIEQVQEMIIHAYLGTDLYEAIQTEIENGTLSNNSNREKLVNSYIVPILLNGVVDQIIPTLNYKFANTGILKQSDDNSENATKDELEYLRGTYRTVMNTYIERMINFIADNSGDFDEYYTTDWEDVNPTDPTTASGLYVGRYADDNPNNWDGCCRDIEGYSYPGKWKRIN